LMLNLSGRRTWIGCFIVHQECAYLFEPDNPQDSSVYTDVP
jgi:hypothetical protein